MTSYRDVTLEETKQANRQILRMLDTGTPLVHVIVNQTELGGFPISVTTYRDILTAMRHDALGWVVVYGNTSALADFIAVMVARIGRIRYRKFADKENAIAFLKEHDTSLKLHDTASNATR